jgi:type IV secretory pathway TrbL component
MKPAAKAAPDQPATTPDGPAKKVVKKKVVKKKIVKKKVKKVKKVAKKKAGSAPGDSASSSSSLFGAPSPTGSRDKQSGASDARRRVRPGDPDDPDSAPSDES